MVDAGMLKAFSEQLTIPVPEPPEGQWRDGRIEGQLPEIKKIVLRWYDLGHLVAKAVDRHLERSPSRNIGIIVGADVLQEHLFSPVDIDWTRFWYAPERLMVHGCPVQLLGWAQGITVYLRD